MIRVLLILLFAGEWSRPLADHVVEAQIKIARKSGEFLDQGDVAAIRVDRTGALETPID